MWGPQRCKNAYIVTQNLNASDAKILGQREYIIIINCQYHFHVKDLNTFVLFLGGEPDQSFNCNCTHINDTYLGITL